jgi:hypothetical protein
MKAEDQKFVEKSKARLEIPQRLRILQHHSDWEIRGLLAIIDRLSKENVELRKEIESYRDQAFHAAAWQEED